MCEDIQKPLAKTLVLIEIKKDSPDYKNNLEKQI